MQILPELTQLGLKDMEGEYVLSFNGAALTENKDNRIIEFNGLGFDKMKEIFDEVLASAYRCGRHYFFAMAANHTFTAQDDVVLIKCRRLFDEAERMAGNDEFLKRIKKARMWLRLMEICKMPVGEPGRDVKLDIWEKDCVAFAYDVMGCAPTMNVTEFCNFLREKSDTHP